MKLLCDTGHKLMSDGW